MASPHWSWRSRISLSAPYPYFFDRIWLRTTFHVGFLSLNIDSGFKNKDLRKRCAARWRAFYLLKSVLWPLISGYPLSVQVAVKYGLLVLRSFPGSKFSIKPKFLCLPFKASMRPRGYPFEVRCFLVPSNSGSSISQSVASAPSMTRGWIFTC